MKKSSKKKVKVLVFALALLLCLALSIGAAGAWYQANRKATGTINMDTGIKIEYTGFHQEVADSDSIWQKDDVEFNLFSTTSVVPGSEVILEPNTTINAGPGSVDFYARFKLDYKFYTDLEGTAEATGINPTDVLVPSADFINSAWVESGDGFYYLASGTTLTALKTGGTPAAFFADGAKYTINTNIGGEGFGYQVDADTTIVRADVILTLEVAQVGTPWEITPLPVPPVVEDLSTNVLQDTSGNAVTGDVVAGTTYQIVDESNNGLKYTFALNEPSTLNASVLSSGVSNLSSVVVDPSDVDGTATVTGYTGSPTDVVIPDYIVVNGKSYKVTSVGKVSFYYCDSLTSILIGNSVTSIGTDAFQGCKNLTKATIPNSVTSIGNYAFYNCNALANVNIPDGVTSIGNYVFANCRALLSITIPDGVTQIGDLAFSGCGLTNIIVPDGVTQIGVKAFSVCALTNITIPGSVTSIGNGAFSSCASLTSATILEGVLSIGDTAFYACTRLTDVVIPDSVTSMGDEIFRDCQQLTSIAIPDGVTKIGDRAFWGCSSLTSITIPDSVTSIGVAAFGSCYGLTSLSLPNRITSIGNSAFNNCSNLTEMTILATTPPAFGRSSIPTNVATVYVPAGTTDAYRTALTNYNSTWGASVTITEVA